MVEKIILKRNFCKKFGKKMFCCTFFIQIKKCGHIFFVEIKFFVPELFWGQNKSFDPIIICKKKCLLIENKLEPVNFG